jgi:hypothetical protein
MPRFALARKAAPALARMLALVAGACVTGGIGGETDPDRTGGPDAGSGGGPGGDAALAGCAPGVAGCTCVADPGPDGCIHSLGGRFSAGACSPSYQCCDGAWQSGHGACGECSCVDGGEEGCGTERQACFPAFASEVIAIPPPVRDDMTGVSWHAGMGCPSLDSLRLVTLSHWGFDGEIHTGELVVAEAAASQIVSAFERIYDAGWPIERIERVDAYGGNDNASMAANNTSAFNCRKVTGGSSLSEHSFGTAIDINPVQNPYVNGNTVLPPAGAAYVTRSPVQPGMITRPGPVVRAFEAIDWGWGGDWDGFVDYQHLSASGR